MNQQPHIVLTVDFSAESLRAVAPTVELARRLGARVSLVHVVPELLLVPLAEGFVPPQSASAWAAQLDHARARLAEVRRTMPADLDVKVELLSGESIEKVVTQFAEKQGADFIAMATHGRSGLRRIAFGSVCEAILHQAETPVLVFPRKAHDGG